MKAIRLDFVVAGAPKAATTSLVDALRTHPDVYVPSQKELSFFDREDCVARLEELEPHFAQAVPGQLLGEGTPWYMSSPQAAEILSRLYPDIRVVFVVRDPVARARSHYLSRVSRSAEHRTFEQTLDDEIRALRAGSSGYHANYLIEPGLYASHLKTWLSFLPREQIKVVLFRDLIRDSQSGLKAIQEHLGLAPRELALPVSNRTPGVRVPSLGRLAARLIRSENPAKRALALVTPKTFRSRIGSAISELNQSDHATPHLAIGERELARLLEYFGPDVEELEGILGLSLEAWRTA